MMNQSEFHKNFARTEIRRQRPSGNDTQEDAVPFREPSIELANTGQSLWPTDEIGDKLG
jgi:hypothetical protein